MLHGFCIKILVWLFGNHLYTLNKLFIEVSGGPFKEYIIRRQNPLPGPSYAMLSRHTFCISDLESERFPKIKRRSTTLVFSGVSTCMDHLVWNRELSTISTNFIFTFHPSGDWSSLSFYFEWFFFSLMTSMSGNRLDVHVPSDRGCPDPEHTLWNRRHGGEAGAPEPRAFRDENKEINT